MSNYLETKVISVVVVIQAVTFLQHFIRREDPLATLQFGAAFALVSGARGLFLWNSQQCNKFEGARPGRAEAGGRRAVPRRPGGAHHHARPQPVQHGIGWASSAARPGLLLGAGLPGLIACSL